MKTFLQKFDTIAVCPVSQDMSYFEEDVKFFHLFPLKKNKKRMQTQNR